MQVADGQNLRCATQFGTKCRPKLSPAVKGSPQKQERTFLHLFMLEAEVRQYHRGTAAHPVVVAYGGLPDVSCLVSCRPWEPRAAVLLLAHATYSNVQGMLTLVGEKELFLGLGMTGVHSTVVVRNRASTLHNLLQLAASSMETDFNRG